VGRSPASTRREELRARSSKKLVGRRNESEDGCLTGHPAFLQMSPAYEMEVMPEGGGYPEGFIPKVAKLMGCTDVSQVLHICSGSVRGVRTLDWRPPWGLLGCPDADVFTPMLRWEDRRAHLVECPHEPAHPRTGGSSCSVVGDARELPFRTASVRWIMADPPYEVDYAEALWGLGKRYPTPIVLLKEAARVLVPGGMIAFLHHLVPILPDGLERVKLYGLSTGPGYRMRALTIARRADVGASLFDAGAAPDVKQRAVDTIESSLL
jgi:SAM-dependent methyltransferase